MSVKRRSAPGLGERGPIGGLSYWAWALESRAQLPLWARRRAHPLFACEAVCSPDGTLRGYVGGTVKGRSWWLLVRRLWPVGRPWKGLKASLLTGRKGGRTVWGGEGC